MNARQLENQEGLPSYRYDIPVMSRSRHLFGMLLAFACLLTMLPVYASSILLINSADAPIYREVEDAFRAEAESLCAKNDECPRIASILARDLSDESARDHDLLVLIGQQAKDQANNLTIDLPQLHLMVFREEYDRQAPCCDRTSAIYIEQPLERQLRFIRFLLPKLRRIAVLIGPGSFAGESELLSLARGMGLEVELRRVASQRDIGPVLHQLRNEVDILLALPDPRVYNRDTVSNILLSTYRNRIPVIGFSKGLVHAGALAAIHSSPGTIGTEAAGKALQILRGMRPDSTYPEQAEFTLNRKVARSLHLQIPTDDALEARWGKKR